MGQMSVLPEKSIKPMQLQLSVEVDSALLVPFKNRSSGAQLRAGRSPGVAGRWGCAASKIRKLLPLLAEAEAVGCQLLSGKGSPGSWFLGLDPAPKEPPFPILSARKRYEVVMRSNYHVLMRLDPSS